MLYLVKLNNPLMGTETQSYRQRAVFQMLYHVKLNNPLMGTETFELLNYSL